MPLVESNPDTLAEIYARSLFDLADAAGGWPTIETIAGELEELLELTRTDARFNEFLASRTLPVSARAASLERVLKGRVHDLLVRFLLVLNKKRRLSHLHPIAAAFDAMAQERFGRVEVDVYTAEPIGPEERRSVGERLSKALGKEVIVHPYTEPSMIGGVRLRIGDRLVDASVATQLRRMRERLAQGGTARLRSVAERLVGE